MPLDSQILSQRIAELTKAYQRQIDKIGQLGYDSELTELLKKDLNWMQGQQEDAQPISPEE